MLQERLFRGLPPNFAAKVEQRTRPNAPTSTRLDHPARPGSHSPLLPRSQLPLVLCTSRKLSQHSQPASSGTDVPLLPNRVTAKFEPLERQMLISTSVSRRHSSPRQSFDKAQVPDTSRRSRRVAQLEQKSSETERTGIATSSLRVSRSPSPFSPSTTLRRKSLDDSKRHVRSVAAPNDPSAPIPRAERDQGEGTHLVPPISGVRILPSAITRYTAAAIWFAWWSRPRCRSIIVAERIMAAGLATSCDANESLAAVQACSACPRFGRTLSGASTHPFRPL